MADFKINFQIRSSDLGQGPINSALASKRLPINLEIAHSERRPKRNLIHKILNLPQADSHNSVHHQMDLAAAYSKYIRINSVPKIQINLANKHP